MGFKASSSWFLASKGFVLSSTSARAWIGLRFKVEKSCEAKMKGDVTLFQLFEFLIHDFYGFFHKVELNIKLKFFHWNDKGFVRYAFLYIRNVEGTVDIISSSGSSSLYATGLSFKDF
ncbi:hypothetical protein Tco_0872155 [Tanacetum coccineum]